MKGITSSAAFRTLAAVAAATALAAACRADAAGTVVSVSFSETPAPATVEEMVRTHTNSVATLTYADGSRARFPLRYRRLFGVRDRIARQGDRTLAAGQLYDHRMEPLQDPFGRPVIAETPDGNSLLEIDGRPFLVTHYEYDWLLSDGTPARKARDWYRRMPMSMTLAKLQQDPKNGALSVETLRPIDLSSVNGLWVPCAASQTPWNTHLGSEEDYDLEYSPLSRRHRITLEGERAMSELYFRNRRKASRYRYGHIPEVRVKADGTTTVTKHYALGRGAWEKAQVMPDRRTVYLSDDGNHVMLAMYVGDAAENLDAGTLYAARWVQTAATAGGRARLRWIRLGHATSAEIEALARHVRFEDIFDAVAPARNGRCPAGYQRIRAGSSSDECLKVRPGMQQAAAFLETRRYAALRGATTEWRKMEGIALNPADRRLYLAVSTIANGMTRERRAPADHIRLPGNKAGAVYTLNLGSGVRDADGDPIPSDHVAVEMFVEPALLGRPLARADARGNTAAEDRIANPDNLFFSEGMRTLFIGEDSGMHLNNYLWAYEVDSGRLTRILSATAGAELAGLQVVDDLGGHAYILSNTQHHGDLPRSVPKRLARALRSRIDRLDAQVGYIAGLPAIRRRP